MPRPGFELRQLEDEERRRARAHRKLHWARRGRQALVLLGAGLLVGLVLIALRVAGVPVG